jgi:hypothetical protein
MRSRTARRASAAVAAALSVAWIVVILPALSPASFRPEIVRGAAAVRDWRHVFLDFGDRLGSSAAAMGSMVWAWWVGALDPQVGLWKPWKVESWILDVFGFGGVFGALAAAALPPWLVWWVSRIVARPPVGARVPALSLVRALAGAVKAAMRSPSGWALLAALALIGERARTGVAWSLGRHGGDVSLPGLVAGAGIGALVGVASVRLGLALLDARALDAGDLLGGPRRVASYAVTAGALSALGLLGLALGILPGVALAATFGFAPFVAAEEGVWPLQALAGSAALTRGARWPLVRIGATVVGVAAGASYLLGRTGVPALPETAVEVLHDVVLGP